MPRLPGDSALDRQVVQQIDQVWRLVASQCPTCSDIHYPPRELCVYDLQECETVPVSAEGIVYEAVRVEVPPVGFVAPYWVAYVDFPEGIRVFAPLQWSDAAREPGQGVRVRCRVGVVRTDPYEVLGPVFHPVVDGERRSDAS